MEILTPIALAFFLALAVERLIEWFFKGLISKIADETYRTLTTRLLTLLFGGLVAFSLGLDLITPLAETAGVVIRWPLLPPILTAVIVGGGSTLLHDLWPNKAVTGLLPQTHETVHPDA